MSESKYVAIVDLIESSLWVQKAFGPFDGPTGFEKWATAAGKADLLRHSWRMIPLEPAFVGSEGCNNDSG